jgi:ParB/Sulfiredoxin domain
MAENEVAAGANGGASENAVQAAKLNTSEDSTSANARKNPWRDHIKVHPAANLFPLMSPDELRELGKDIKKNGLRYPVALIVGDDGKLILIDGRNRLDAMELVGLDVELEKVAKRVCTLKGQPGYDPYAYVISANIHRRHLTAEQRRDLIAKLIKATPKKSNRQIAEAVKVSHVTVGAVRAELEATGQIDQLKKTVGKDGRSRKAPAKRRAERHRCWQCDVRAPVGEVQEHSYPAYGDADVWLHDACVAAFEAREAAARDVAHDAEDDPERSAEARKREYAEDDIKTLEAGLEPDSCRAFLVRADQARRDAVYTGPINEEVVTAARATATAWAELAVLIADAGAAGDQADPFAIPDFMRRTS